MRIFSFFGHSNTGKTALIEKLVERLNEEGYRTGYLKLTRHKGPFDAEGKDTYRIFKKGVKRIALLHEKGSVLWNYSVEDMVEFIKRHFQGVDFLLIEGNAPIAVPKAQCIKMGEEKVKDPLLLFTCSYDNAGDFHLEKDFDRIYDVVLKKSMPLLPHIDCEECGFKTCRDFAKAYLKNEVKLKDCRVLSQNAVVVRVDGKRIEIKSFVQDFLGSTILGALSSLKGFEEGGKIQITIDPQSLKALKMEEKYEG